MTSRASNSAIPLARPARRLCGACSGVSAGGNGIHGYRVALNKGYPARAADKRPPKPGNPWPLGLSRSPREAGQLCAIAGAVALRRAPCGRWYVLARPAWGARRAASPSGGGCCCAVARRWSLSLQKSAPVLGPSQPVFIKRASELYKSSGPRQSAARCCPLTGDELRATVKTTEGQLKPDGNNTTKGLESWAPVSVNQPKGTAA